MMFPAEPKDRDLGHAVMADEPFRIVFLSSKDAILILSSPKHKIIDVNPQACRMFGYRHEQFLGLPPERIICVNKAQWECLLHSVTNNRSKWLRGMACCHSSGRTMVRDILPSSCVVGGRPCILIAIRDGSPREISQVLRSNARFTRFSNAVAAGAAQAPDIKHAIQFCLQQICDYAHWVFAHAHFFSKRIMEAHVPPDIWHFGLHERYKSLKTASETKRLHFDDRWYSRVATTAEPTVLEEVGSDLEFAPRPQGVSVKSALIVPILTGNEIVGIFQYFSAEPISRDQIFLNTMSLLASKLGDIIEQKRSTMSVRSLSAKLFHAQDDERRKLARELHDTTAQNLTAALMDLGVVEREDRLTSKAQRALSESISLTRRSLQELRTLSYLLHPPMLDELGLLPALRIFIEGFSQRSGMHVRLDAPESCPGFSKELEMACFRVVQEGLTNARRHSGSMTANVRLKLEEGELRLRVENETTSELLRSQGLAQGSKLGVGMRSMQERVEQLGGRLTLNIDQNSSVLQAAFPFAGMPAFS